MRREKRGCAGRQKEIYIYTWKSIINFVSSFLLPPSSSHTLPLFPYPLTTFFLFHLKYTFYVHFTSSRENEREEKRERETKLVKPKILQEIGTQTTSDLIQHTELAKEATYTFFLSSSFFLFFFIAILWRWWRETQTFRVNHGHHHFKMMMMMMMICCPKGEARRRKRRKKSTENVLGNFFNGRKGEKESFIMTIEVKYERVLFLLLTLLFNLSV